MRRFLFAVYVILFATGSTAWAWWSGGHGIMTKAAVRSLPDDTPAFFRSGERMIAHCSYDPDISKNRGTPHVNSTEHSEHYLDLELLEGRPLPKNRYELIQLCTELGVKPGKVGFVPYALAEWTERLAVAFAEHRKWPNNSFIQSKCLVYAGFVAHYAQDMCQPLHLTIHFDGWKQPDGSVLHKGIHEKVDALIEYLELDPTVLATDQRVEPLDDLMTGIVEELHAGFALVKQVYELGDSLPSYRDKDWERVPEVVDFATERAREATHFTAALYLTAWELSGKLKLEGWLDRARDDGETTQ